MQEIDYSSSPYPVREDLIDEHRKAWRRLAEPGAFLDGARRVAVAREVRNAPACGLCARRKDALSPYAIDGAHDHLGALSPSEVEVVHRIVTDSGRLSRAWVDGILDSGIEDTEYVEIVSIVAVVMVIDTFRRALGLTPFELPEPVAGAPSGYSAPGAKHHDGWIRLVVPEDVVPEDGVLYDGPAVSPVLKALSLVPDAKRAYWDLAACHYLPGDQMTNFATEIRAIDRMQMELVAARVSSLHQCVY
jgi:hypothetical protein